MVWGRAAQSLFDVDDQDQVKVDLSAFFGEKSDYFVCLYEKMRQKAGKNKYVRSWNWMVFIAPYVWLFYRKLWVGGVLIFAMPILMSFIVPDVGGGAALGVAVVFAMYANGWYVVHGLSRIAKADKLGLTGDDRIAYLRAAGGTSPVAAGFAATIFCAQIGLMILGLMAARAGG